MTIFYPLVTLLTVYAVWQVLRMFGVFEFKRQPHKVVSQIQKERFMNRKRRSEQKRLSFYASVTNTFRGILMSQFQYEQHQYYIQRLEIRSDVLNRFYTPEELRGKYAVWLLVGVFSIPLCVISKYFLLIPALCLLYYLLYPSSLKGRIEEEDRIIDNNFLNLYLLMYAKLRQGSRARVQNVIESYIETESKESDVQVRNTMLKLARYILNNLTQYEDHVAIPKLRERYKSATIINFCNIAGQALQGVHNEDSLLTFKMYLIERKTAEMEKRSNRILAIGQKSIYLIWVILFFFVACGWYAKLPTNYV